MIPNQNMFTAGVLVVFITTACSTLIAPSHQTMGKQYLENGEYQEAIQEFIMATNDLHMAPDYVIDSWVLLGEAYEKYHHPENAVLAYKSALDAIAQRINKIPGERVEATIAASSSLGSRGSFEKLNDSLKLQAEELRLRRKYREITTKIENIDI